MTNHGPEARPIIPEDVVSVVKLPAERGSLRFPLRRVLIGEAVGGIALPGLSAAAFCLTAVILNKTPSEIVSVSNMVPLLVAEYLAGIQVGGFVGLVTSK